jgi:CheY-like chemotaxis protein
VDLEDDRILVADGNAMSRFVLSSMLSSMGGRCEEAVQGEDALRRLREAAQAGVPFTLAFLDAKLPGLDGDAIAEATMREPELAGTAPVRLSIMGERLGQERIEALGYKGEMAKPVKRSLLHAVLHAMRNNDSPQLCEKTGTGKKEDDDLKERRGSIQVLLAEDNIINQKVAVKIIEKAGFKVDVAANGVETLKALETSSYDIVLMDCQMPEMDGYEATRRIRDPGSSVLDHAIPIVAMTANAMVGDREQCLDAGMDDYMAKPVNPKMLKSMIDKWTLRKTPS